MRRLLGVAFLISACGSSEAVFEQGEEQLAAASALGGESTVSFNRDWTVTRSSDLVTGSTLRISYDAQRMPDCRQEQGGQPLWSITGYWSLAGQSGSFAAGGASPTTNPLPPIIPLNQAGELQVWFQVHNRSGCMAWDSDFGRNFRFQVRQAGPTIRFLPQGRVEQTASTVGARSVVVEYDPARLPNCRQGYSGLPTWDILLWFRFDGGAISSFPTTRVAGYNERVMSPVLLTVPQGARRLEMWFKSSDRGGCVEWDSRNGANYAFDL
jgi:hypothetical protein